MGYWKRIFVSLLSVSLMFCLSGCGIAEEKKDDGRLKVVATVFAEYDFLRNINLVYIFYKNYNT